MGASRRRRYSSIMRHRPNPRSRNPRPTKGPRSRRSGLELCPACGTDFVNPVEWYGVEDHSWWMRLRCAQCEHSREVVVSNAEAERFDEALDSRARPDRPCRPQSSISSAWRPPVETLIVALQRDLIGPADFAR